MMCSHVTLPECTCVFRILVPRVLAPFGQHQESRPPARSNTRSPRFTDFPSLCACSESSLANLIGSGLNLYAFTKPFRTGTSLDRTRGTYHSTENSGTNFRKFPLANGTVFFQCGRRQLFAWNFSMTSRFKSQIEKQTDH